MVAEEEIKDVEGYLKVIKLYKGRNVERGNTEDFLFRGQVGDYPLISKISRLKPKGDLIAIEQLLLKEFKRTNPLLIETHRPYDDWDYLTLGQHFGLPTRLLDWSNNALTALWFATESHTSDFNAYPYRVVWILMPDSYDFISDIENLHPFVIEETKIFRPRIIKQRINNQSGVFSVQSNNEIKEKCQLSAVDSFKNKLLKIKIPAENTAQIREDLNTLGVNAFAIFPELEGLCTHLQWRYFF
jgi:hypothetical protein